MYCQIITAWKLKIDKVWELANCSELAKLDAFLNADPLHEDSLLSVANSQESTEFKTAWKDVVNILKIPADMGAKLSVPESDAIEEQMAKVQPLKDRACNLIAVRSLFAPLNRNQTVAARTATALDHIGVIGGVLHPRLSVALGLKPKPNEAAEEEEEEQEE